MSEFQLNYQLNNDPDDYLLEFHPSGPSFNHYRREFRRIQNENKPPDAVTEDGLSEDDSTPEPYSPPSTSPSPPSSIATMDLEIMDMARDVNQTPVHTPIQRRARSLEPSINRLSMNTPNERYRQNPHYPHSSLNTPAPPTPHAMAARRALEDRRIAMFTPGRTRRQSIREQRETPMLILRNLGRALAPTSKVIDSSSSPEKPSPNGVGNRGASSSRRGAGRRNSDEDDELPIDRPRLSLPIDENSSDDLQPPHSSILEDPNMTIQSVELPRRATSEGPPRRSFGYLGDSDITPWDDIYGNDDTNPDPFAYPPGIAPHAPTDPEIADLQFPPGVGRESDFTLDMPSGLSDNEQTTFYMRSPAVDTVEAVPEDVPTPGSDDVPLMERRQSERGRLLEQAGEEPGEQQDEQQDEQQGEQPDEQPSVFPDDQFPDMGDFEHVPDLGDAEMDALTRFDAETFAQDPVRPGDEWIGYPPGRPRKRRREDDEESARAEAEAQAQAQAQAEAQARARAQARAQVRVSAHGIQYPPVVSTFVRQVVQNAAQNSALGHQRLAADALETFSRASDWFFRQLGDDLRAYAEHARRSVVEERDLIALMHRQRVVNAEQSLFHLASHNLPRELQQLLRSNNPGYQSAYPVAQQSGTYAQQPLANAQSETTNALRSFVPNPPSPSHTGSKRKRDEEDDGDSDDESLVFPEDDDY